MKMFIEVTTIHNERVLINVMDIQKVSGRYAEYNEDGELFISDGGDDKQLLKPITQIVMRNGVSYFLNLSFDDFIEQTNILQKEI